MSCRVLWADLQTRPSGECDQQIQVETQSGGIFAELQWQNSGGESRVLASSMQRDL